jgi:hypothetical protein
MRPRTLTIAIALVLSLTSCASRRPESARAGAEAPPPASTYDTNPPRFKAHIYPGGGFVALSQRQQTWDEEVKAMRIPEMLQRIHVLEQRLDACQCARLPGQPARGQRDPDCLYNCGLIQAVSEKTKCENRCPVAR